MKLNVDIFTTGMIAKMFGTSCRTVAKWCDSGILKHTLLPGSKDRRVYRDDLIEFVNQRKFRLPSEFYSEETSGFKDFESLKTALAEAVDLMEKVRVSINEGTQQSVLGELSLKIDSLRMKLGD